MLVGHITARSTAAHISALLIIQRKEKAGEVYHRVVKSDGVMGSKGGESVCTPGECLSESVASDTDVFLSSLHVKSDCLNEWKRTSVKV